MRYKVISSAIAVLLIATPVFAQKSVPILTQTLRTTKPTTVITGQTLKQTYAIKFIDLTHKNEEIIIKKEDLDMKTLGDFEVVDFEIEYESKQAQFLEHYWYVNYTLRIINPQKGPKVIPSFVVPWKLKKFGQQDDDPNVQYDYDMKTKEVHLNYVSTIPQKDPYLAIRDQMDFGTFKMNALVLNIASWSLAIVPSGLWLAFFIWRFRSSSSHPKEEKAKIVQTDEPVSKVVKISKRKTNRQLKKAIRRLTRMGTSKNIDSALKIMPELYLALMGFLRNKVQQSTVGTTGTEMSALIEKLRDGANKQALVKLAERATYYQCCLEEGKLSDYWPVNPFEDAKLLKKSLKALSWHMSIINYLASVFRRRW